MYRPRSFACITALAAAGLASAALASPAPSLAVASAAALTTPVTSVTSAPASAAPAAPAASPASATPPRIVVTPDAIRLPGQPRHAPLTTGQCEETEAIACYSPDQIRAAYNLP